LGWNSVIYSAARRQGWDRYIFYLRLIETFTDIDVTTDWVGDKISSKFAFEAMCWQKSKIPLAVWQAGDATTNPVESAHQDAYREGIECSVVEATLKGQMHDNRKITEHEVSL
jgi:hypothetical protein